MSTASVLVVEDDPDVREMIATALELEGADVLTAANGKEAYDIARARLPKLIILDLMMPVMTGEEFRNAQLALDTIRDIPVVVLSAHHDTQQIAARMNAVAWLHKPVDIDALHDILKTFST